MTWFSDDWLTFITAKKLFREIDNDEMCPQLQYEFDRTVATGHFLLESILYECADHGYISVPANR